MNNIDSQLSMPDFFSMFGSFILVLLLLGLVLFILKKIQMKSSVSNGGRKIQIIEVMPTSNKQKIMLLKVENQQFLVGVSGQNLNQLGHWSASEPMPEKEKDGFNDYYSDSETGMNNNTHQKKPSTQWAEKQKKQSLLGIDEIKPTAKPSALNKKLSKFSELSSIKQTQNLLSFAKQIRCTLNQSIEKTQRVL